MVENHVDIGFVEECEPWKLESRFFPSKVGGKPAWLNLNNLPGLEALECLTCKKQLIFLSQLYAPYEEDENNFHRTLFIFVCRTPTCIQNKEEHNIKVFRSQLPRDNKFYSSEPPDESHNPNLTISNRVKLCTVCGCLAQKHCTSCKEIYCCKEHQVIAWKEGHKLECNSEMKNSRPSKILFPEYELVIEPETLENNIVDENEQLVELQKLQENVQMLDVSESELETYVSTTVEDKAFTYFQKRIKQEPEQVIRYQRGGEPLWIAKEPIPNEVPDCEYCKGPRQFDFK